MSAQQVYLARVPMSEKTRRPRVGLGACALATLVVLGGCGVNRVLPPPTVPYDYRDRHPVVLAEAAHTLDLFPPPEGARLDNENVARIAEYASNYRHFGRGKIALLAPTGASAAPRRAVDQIKRALAQAGIGADHIILGSYPVSDAHLSAPIRLSFQGIKAKTAHRCGDWPQDLASGGSFQGWQNESYWNFGCATQATLAAQVADPRDIAAARGETPADIEMRMRSIGKVREGSSPTTNWDLKGNAISGIGGN